MEKYLNGREVAVWGGMTRPLSRILTGRRHCAACVVDRQKHYVVAVSPGDYEDFRADAQSEPFEYVADCIIFDDPGGELPFEWECFGAKIGRQTYFGEGIAGGCENGYIKSIGHFTSINGSADIGVNHQLDMVFTSDDIVYFFNEKNKAEFNKRLGENPARPYMRGKEKITIGSDVYIGANAFINASKVTRIGDGAVIGSGAVVICDIPPYAVAAGVPAKIIRYRFPPEAVEIFLRVKWWEWAPDEINMHADALMSPEIFIKRFG